MPVTQVPRNSPIRFLFDWPTRIHWGRDDWQNVSDELTKPGMLGLHVAEIPADSLTQANSIRFALQDIAGGKWGDGDRTIRII
jgi:hypothetical protein